MIQQKYDINNAPLSWRHFWITGVASLGQLIGTGLATLVSVIIPLYQINAHPELDSFLQGLIGAMDLIGIMVGSAILGRLSDKYGYLLFFRLCPALICGSAFLCLFLPSVPILIISLFLMGFGIGGEYSLDSDYISELMPDKWRFIMVGGAKAASALGNIGVAGICFLIVRSWTNADLWPHLMWIIIFISGLMLLLRIRFWQSPKWLEGHGKIQQAQVDLTHFLGPDITITSQDAVNDVSENHYNIDSEADNKNNIESGKDISSSSDSNFFKKYWKEIIYTGIPWACEGLGVYGIGVFLPILVMALGIEHLSPDETQLQHVVSSVEITLWISCIILPGFILGLFLINKMNGGKIQWLGFLLSAVSLLFLLLAYHYKWESWISIVAFMCFELFLNMGPHLMTYVLPSKVYPIEVRGQGTGIAASIGKVGAVLGVFFIPILLKSGGSSLVLIVSIIVMLIGGVITFIFDPKRKKI